ILAEGVEVIVGPVGPQNVRAAVEVSGAAGMLILPGEGADDARGVAPSLEDRGAALARHALAAHAPTVIVLSPEGEYGKRVAAGVQGVVQESASNALKLIRYPSSTTSFKAILDPILSSLRGGAWLIVADQISRTELVLRQLGREGLTIAKANGAGVVVMATGEGIAAASSVLEGVWVAPAAWETEDVRDAMFAAEYQGQEGVLPGDQAWLVWRALALAWQGPQAADVPKSAEPRIYRVQGGQLVEHRPQQAEAAIIRPPE
ncbi:MAG: hypothetical protein KC636_18815, partial [Myxococcales bacterium]|nr:hypothetical protein [Myxococcales bacterium]